MRCKASIWIGTAALVGLGYGRAYGSCDSALLHKLLDKGFTKAEILRLCGDETAPQPVASPVPVRPPEPHLPKPQVRPQTPTPSASPPSSAPQQRLSKRAAPAPSAAATPALRAETAASGPHTLTVYHDLLVGGRKIDDARLQVAPETRQVTVEVEIFERAGEDSTRSYEMTPVVPYMVYDAESQSVVYTGPNGDQHIVCGQLVQRRALLGSSEEIVLTDNCRLAYTTQTTAAGRGFLAGRRTYGTVVLHINTP